MKKLLLFALLVVGCLFGDTIKYQNLMGDILIINNVEYVGIEGNMVYYTLNNEKSQIYCPRILEITDVGGWQIEFECAKTKQLFTPSSKPSIESNSISKRKLKQAGNHLVQFRKDYYTGFMVSMLGNVATLYGASENKGDIVLYGGVASLLGGILMLISFDSAGEAGEDLIDAGEKLEAEQPKEDE